MICALTPILMANFDRSGPGLSMPAADVKPGSLVWTQDAVSMEWGAFRVLDVKYSEAPVLRAEGYPRATEDHCFWRSPGWIEMSSLGEPDGVAQVAKITVERAHTYVSNSALSHSAG